MKNKSALLLLLSYLIYSLPIVDAKDNSITSKWKGAANESASTSIHSRSGSRLLFHGQPIQETSMNVKRMQEDLSLAIFNTQTQRKLGDFDALNAILAGISFKVPDTSFKVDMPWPLPDADADAEDIICFDISFEDMQVDHEILNSQEILVKISVTALRLECDFDWSFDYGISGNGDGQMYANDGDSNIVSEIIFTSPNFNEHPPNDSYVKECEANIDVNDMDFQGGLSGAILNTFEGAFRSYVEDEIKKTVCEELDGLGMEFIRETLLNTEELLDQWIDHELGDPLAAENDLSVPDEVQLLDFLDSNSTMGTIFGDFLDMANENLGGSTVTDDGTSDLGINIAMREYLLDENGIYSLNISDLGFSDDGLIFDGEDMLSETKVWVKDVRIYGLDSFTEFDGLVAIGSQTLRTTFKMENIKFEADMTLEIKASQNSDSVIVAPGGPTVTEDITVDIVAENLSSEIAFMLAIDEIQVGDIELGSILNMDQVLSCMLSTLYTPIEITRFTAEAETINHPTLTGFISPGIDRVVSAASEAAFDMYDVSFKKAMPGLFDFTIRNSLNNFTSDYLDNEENVACKEAPESSKDGNVDFRDLLLTPAESLLVGGSGDMRYGDVLPALYEVLMEFLNSTDSDGTLNVNSAFIAPFTEDQSGTPGKLVFGEDLLDISYEFDDSIIEINEIGISSSGIGIENLNTVKAPLVLLDPTNATILDNSLNFDSTGQPLRSSIDLTLKVNSSYFIMDDTIELSIDISDAEIFASLMAIMKAESLMELPLRDIGNLNCWLNTIPTPTLDDDGIRVEDDPSLSLEELTVSYSSIILDLACAECESLGMKEASTMFELVEDYLKNATDGIIDAFIEALNDDFTQIELDRYMNQSVTSCPSHPDYNSTDIVTVFDLTSIPLLTEASWEDFVVLSYTMIEIGIAILALNIAEYSPPESDPLSAQNNLTIPDDVQLLNLANDSVVSYALDELSEYLEGSVETSNGSDLQINELIRDFILDEDGKFTYMIDINVPFGEASLSLDSISISGLDSFTALSLFEAIGNQTLHFAMALENLKLELDMSLDIPFDSSSTVLTKKDDNRQTESFRMVLDIEKIDFTLAMFIAIDLQKMEDLKLGSLLFSENIISCLLSTLYTDLEVTEFTVDFEEWGDISIEGLSSSYATDTMQSVSSIMRDNYGDEVKDAVPILIEVAGLAILSEAIKEFSSTSCPPPIHFSNDRFLDFRDFFLSPEDAVSMGATGEAPYGDVMVMLKELLDTTLLTAPSGSDNELPINDLVISPLTDDGSLSVEGDLFSTEFGIKQIGFEKISLRVYNTSVSNLDSLGSPTNILDPSSAHILDNNITVGTGGKPVLFGARIVLTIESGDTTIHNDFEFSMAINSTETFLQVMAMVETDAVFEMPLKDIDNVYCWLATIVDPLEIHPSMTILELVYSLENADVTMVCNDCSSPGVVEMVNIVNSPSSPSSKKFMEDLNSFTHTLLEGGFMQSRLDQLILDSKTKCPHRDEYGSSPQSIRGDYEEESFSTSEFESIVVLGSVICSALVLSMLIMFKKFLSDKSYQKSLSYNEEKILSHERVKAIQLEKFLNTETTSLLRSSDIPLFIRILTPVVVVVNIGFFLSGHLNKGASVLIDVNLGGQMIRINDFFTFSMAKSTMDMWEAGAKELAIIILIFSGIWPYTKQLLTLALWCLPPSVIPVHLRGSVLLWLDKLAKWSMLDIFMLVISLVAFRATMENPDWGFLPDVFYSVELLVVPLWGLYANMIAQLISQVSSHWIIYYHRTVLKLTKERRDIVNGELSITRQEREEMESIKESTRKHLFYSVESGEKYMTTSQSSVTVLSITICTFILFILGCVLPSFELDILGLVGIAINVGNDGAATVQHSLFSMIDVIMEQAEYLGNASDYIGLLSLCILFILTAFIVPILQCTLLAFIWFIPVNLKALKRSLYFVEILEAWQYAEVYLLTVCVATLNLGEVSTYMINEYCGSLDYLFQFAVQYEILDVEDGQCFYVDPAIKQGFYVLLVACVMLWGLQRIVVQLSIASVEERKAIEKGDNDALVRKPSRFFGVGWVLSKWDSTSSVSSDENSNTEGVEVGQLSSKNQIVKM